MNRYKRLRQKRLSNGFCVSCGKNPPAEGLTRCESCRNRHNVGTRALKQSRKEAGLCACGNLAIDGFKSCETCRSKSVKHHEQKEAINIAHGKCFNSKCTNLTEERYCEVCKAKRKRSVQKYRRSLKTKVLQKYGGKCACCGEDELLFLTIDHIDGNGAAHRRSLPYGKSTTSTRIYRWLRDNDYPGGFQVLCMNCNLGKHLNGGVCPHEAQVDN